MTQTDIPAWIADFQMKLVKALDEAWRLVNDGGDDPENLRRAREKAKAIGLLAGVARRVGMVVTPASRKALMDHAAASLGATQAVANLSAAIMPATAQAAHAKKALALKSGRGRL